MDRTRGFHELLDLEDAALPEAPVGSEGTGDTFAALWRRLQRLDAYEPLALLSFEQTQIDYHPPVRLHSDEVIAEELHFPGPAIYVDLDQEGLFDDFVSPLYRLDGSVQLRRSRFLHLQFDLEYRVDDPGWAEWQQPEEWSQPGGPPDEAARTGDGPFTSESVPEGANPDETAPEPFMVHTLRQSRQVRTGVLHYFDTEFLGAIARVTPLEETP